MNKNTMNPLHEKALNHAKKGDYNHAIDCFNEALRHDPDNAVLHNNLGNAYRGTRQWEQACAHYQKAVALQPDYAQALCNLGALAAFQQDYPKALRFYRDAVHANPEWDAAHYQLGLLLLKQGEWDAAAIQFQNVTTLNPGHTQAYFYLGILHLKKNAFDAAESAFQTVLAHDKTHVEAYNNLGVIALKQDRGQEAVHYFTQALAYDNQHEESRANLANVFMLYDRFENAKTHYDRLLEQAPDNFEYRYNIGCAEMSLGHLKEAIQHFNHLIKHDAAHYAAYNNLAAIHMRLNEKEKAIALLKKALSVKPDETVSQHMLNALEGCNTTPSTTPEYAKNLFNYYAPNYETHLKTQLNYQLPGFIQQQLASLHITKDQHCLDIGCGTGLIGEILKTFSDHITGVDISAKMLEQAKRKNCYETLIETDCLAWLSQISSTYDVIIAADVFPYFGDLHSLIQQISTHLKPGGHVILSAEISHEKSWMLQPTARFCHHHDYLSSLLTQNHLEIQTCDTVIARFQENQPLSVYLILAQRPE